MDYPEESHTNIILEAKRILLIESAEKLINLSSSDTFISRNNEGKCTPICPTPLNKPLKTNFILKKYFQMWKTIVSYKTSNQETTEKLDKFIDNLKQHQQNHNIQSNTIINKHNIDKSRAECLKNRYKSQKSIIEMQKSKIVEQSKIIDELKLGIIREDLLKSVESTKIDIREIFSNCSQKLLCEAPILQAADEREKIMIKSQKAHKSVQKMQKRAIERAKYRELILERKRIIEETRQRLLQEAIEKKKALEEEERKRNLELINEQRKKELQLQKIRMEKRQELETKYAMALRFYNRTLMHKCLTKLFANYLRAKENNTLAVQYYINKQKRWILQSLWNQIENKFRLKNEIADNYFRQSMLTKYFRKLSEFKLDCIRSMQVAEDLYDLRLLSNTFVYWHRYVCKQIIIEDKKIEIAKKHHNRRLLFQYFYFWKSLPMVNQLERAKAERKRKWRDKVWEIIPDYKPPIEI